MDTVEQIKSAKAVLEQIISDIAEAGKTSDLQKFYDRMVANGEDAERLVKDLKPSTQLERAVEKARNYLCDGDLTVEQQVDLILKSEDDTMLSNIDGVVEWEPVEGRFTVMTFLELIDY